MRRSKLIRPVNSLLFLSDPAGAEQIPQWVRGELIVSTPSCISVGCYPEQDGPTEVVFGNIPDVDPGDYPAFEGMLDTPGGVVVVSTVVGETVMQMKVPEKQCHVKIWVDHPRGPSKVTIGVG